MRLRHLAAAMVAVGLLAVGFSSLGRPASSGPVIELNDGTIQVSATAAGLGSWMPYTITVRNLGEQRFEGDLLLREHAASGAPPAKPRRGVRGLPAELLATAAEGSAAALPPDSAYQFHLLLDGRHKRVLSVTTPSRFSQAEVRDSTGSLVAEVPIGDRGALAVGVVGATARVADSLAGVRFGELAVRPLAWDSIRSLPGAAIGYAGLVAVVLDGIDTRPLSAAQVSALRDFVGLGGILILAASADLEANARSIPADLLPMAPAGRVSTSLQPLADLASQSGAPSISVATGPLGRGARVVLGAPGAPALGTELAYGSGRVEELSFDPADAAVVRGGLDGLAWSVAIGRGLDRLPGNLPAAATLLEPDSIPSRLLPSPADAPLPDLPLLLVLALGYVLAVGPGVYLLVRRTGRPTLAWVAAPGLAVAFSLAAYGAGQVLQGGVRDRQVELVRLGPADTASTLTYHGIVFPQRGAHTITLPAGSLGAPLTLAYPALIPSCAGCYVHVSGTGSGIEEHLQPGPPPAAVETGVVYGSVRVLGEAATTRLPIVLEAHLGAVEDRLRGTITNRGRVPLRDVRLYAYLIDSVQSAALGGDLGPGQTMTVDLALSRAEVLPPGRGRAALPAAVSRRLVADEAAVGALRRLGQVAVVGIADSLGTAVNVDGVDAPRNSLAAVAQSFDLESATGRVGNWTAARLNSSLAGPGLRGALLDSYDLEIPAVSADPVLRYDDRVYAGVEVYNWIDGTWRGDGFEDDIQSPVVRLTRLRPGELSAGRVRVRVREPQLTWGRELVLRYPGETP